MQVYRRWRKLIADEPMFWTRFAVKYTDSANLLERSLLFTANAPLYFRLLLSPADVVAHHLPLPLDAITSMCSLLSVYMEQSKAVFIVVDRKEVLEILHEDLLSGTFPVLQRLTVNYVYGRSMHPDCLRMPSFLPALAALDVRSMSIHLPPSAKYFRLRTFVIRDLDPSVYPTWAEYYSLFSAMPNLTHFSCHNVGCSQFPTSLTKLPKLPRLQQMDISMQSAGSFGLVLAHMDLPEISYLSYDVQGPESFRALSLCGLWIGNVTRLELFGGTASYTHLACVFQAMKRLISLDVHFGGPMFLKALTAAASDERDRCPMLGVICFSECYPTEVRHFVAARSSRNLLTYTVVFRKSLPRSTPNSDLHWLRLNTLLIENQPYVAPKWLSRLKYTNGCGG
ncbi:hypothetical protein DFH06DRAFT_1123090 [Mycena polygramma]|nr:hypothetical protein DFH06DRAFT_1123090 [Mycena polygramma]